MLECSIKGCREMCSELNVEESQRWVRLRACRCGAYDLRDPRSCTCGDPSEPFTSYWPNLDW